MIGNQGYNLVCLDGHAFYCSDPEAWVGRTCGHKEPAPEGKNKTITCREELVPYVDPDAARAE